MSKCEIVDWDPNKKKWVVVKSYKNHKWEEEFQDCQFCGGGVTKVCVQCYKEE